MKKQKCQSPSMKSKEEIETKATATTESSAFCQTSEETFNQKYEKQFLKTSPNLTLANGLKATKISLKNANNVRYPGISEFYSSNSWQNSSFCWLFPKGKRFKTSSLWTHSIYELPNLKSNRTTTQGIGGRKDLRPKYGVGSPSPSAYHIKDMAEYNKKHNIGVKLWGKIKIKDYSSFVPGAGTYEVRKINLMSDMPIKLKSRLCFFYDDDLKKTKHCVSMQRYHPDTILEENLRFRNIPVSFGIGNRTPNDLKSMRGNPGPGTYNIKGSFELGWKKKPVLN